MSLAREPRALTRALTQALTEDGPVTDDVSDPGARTMYHTLALFANTLQETAIAPSCWAGGVIKAGWTVFLFIIFAFWGATVCAHTPTPRALPCPPCSCE